MKHEFSGSVHNILGDAVNIQESTVIWHVLISAVKNTEAVKGAYGRLLLGGWGVGPLLLLALSSKTVRPQSCLLFPRPPVSFVSLECTLPSSIACKECFPDTFA